MILYLIHNVDEKDKLHGNAMMFSTYIGALQ